MTFFVENESMSVFEFEIEQLCELVTKEVLKEERCPYEPQINLLITDLDGIREINKSFRNIDAATDVLSFPALNFERESDFSFLENEDTCFDPDSGELLLGDIMICADKVKEQAVNYGHSEYREFAFLVVHSLLHLCGYDHMEDSERKCMENKQKKILETLGITR